MNYQEFIENKRHTVLDYGFEPVWLPDDCLFDFQRFIVDKAIKKGRMGIFADTGLGKTRISLAIANNIVKKTNKRVLILTPLAVAFQFLKEAELMGIDDIEYSKEGKFTKKIILCNYERLKYFNDTDFECVVLDECFAPDTKIQVMRNKKLHNINIKDCKINDFVINCNGLDKIKAIKRKKVEYAIKIGFNGKEVICSPRHPFFTQRGWVPAKEIQKDDFIISSDKAMRILRGRFSNNLQGGFEEKVLRDILLSEMENESTGNKSESSYKGSTSENRSKKISMVQNTTSGERIGTDKEFMSDKRPESERENFIETTRDKTPTFSAWGQWSRDDITSAINEGCIVRELDSGICYITGKATAGLSNKLQSRFSKLREKNCNRIGWTLSLFEKKDRQEKGRQTGYYGVESFKVLELGCPELDRYRDENGQLYFCDLEIERHPSFTINECLVHNSSILKNFNGQIKNHITSFIKKVPYRFLTTATPSPNDYIELGTSSEALGYMGYMDMLGKFFKNNQNSIDSNNRNIGEKYYLKPHAEKAFFEWVNTWSTMIKKPSDIGFSDDRYKLPKLITNAYFVENQSKILPNGQTCLFVPQAKTMTEVRVEQKQTEEVRAKKAVELAEGKTSVYWVNTNNESSLIKHLDSECTEIIGSQSIEKKEEILKAFANGEIKRLVTKATITGMGLNWQHCNHCVFFPTWSYEQYYQAIRRFWRFGQKNDVTVDLVLSDGQSRVIKALKEKTKKAEQLYENLVKNVNSNYIDIKKNENVEAILPNFL